VCRKEHSARSHNIPSRVDPRSPRAPGTIDSAFRHHHPPEILEDASRYPQRHREGEPFEIAPCSGSTSRSSLFFGRGSAPAPVAMPERPLLPLPRRGQCRRSRSRPRCEKPSCLSFPEELGHALVVHASGEGAPPRDQLEANVALLLAQRRLLIGSPRPHRRSGIRPTHPR